jgi:DNA (cytosine-5)-methyltransferase 1
MTLTVGSLFSGIGGIDLGLERAGMTVKWHSEIDPFACRVLKKHWPHVPNIGDITQVDWEQTPHVDVIAGGYPCQPFSLAGKRAGENDPRHLWPYFRDAISVLRPRYALLENVRGHLSMGGLSVIGDLAAIGYDAEWRIVSAASVGANHQRDRLIIVAHPTIRDARDSQSHRVGTIFGQAAESRERCCNRRPVSDWWQGEPHMGRVADGVSCRVDRLRGLGNAVVPQVAEVIGRLIMEHAHD